MTTKLTLPVPDELDEKLKVAASDNKRSKTMEALHRLELSFLPPVVTYLPTPWGTIGDGTVWTPGSTTTSPSRESE